MTEFVPIMTYLMVIVANLLESHYCGNLLLVLRFKIFKEKEPKMNNINPLSIVNSKAGTLCLFW